LAGVHEVVGENPHDISGSHIPNNDAEAEVVVLVHHGGARVGVLLVVSGGDTDTHRSHFLNNSSSREGIRKESNEEERARMVIAVE
jgi:hypothetical protein